MPHSFSCSSVCPGVLEDLAVDELDLAGGGQQCNQPWNAVHEEARRALAFAQGVLRPLSLVDVGLQQVPEHDPSARISQRKAASVEPAVHPVRTAEARLEVVRTAGFDGFLPSRVDAGAILWMKALGGRPAFQFLDGRTEYSCM